LKKKRKEYNINSDFDKWKDFNPPLDNKLVLWFFQTTMGWIDAKIKTDDMCEVKKFKIPYGKDKTMKAILFSPKTAQGELPCLMYMHGGGFVLPAGEHHYNNAKKYACGASCRVLFLDYPLSPKYKYPVAVNACYDAYKWMLDNAKELEIDKNKIIVGGDSAGGNLASIVCMKAHDNKDIMPIGQMLIYPSVNSGFQTKSMIEFTDTPLCNSEDCQKYQKYYFKNEEDMYTRYVSPLNAKDLNIFPPTYIETAEFDCLRDEAKIFARKLKSAKVDVVINNTKETMHGYDIVEDSPITLKSISKRVEFLNDIIK